MAAGRAYAPTWLATGLFLGCLMGWCLFRTAPAAAPRVAVARPAPAPAVPATLSTLAEVENLFRLWGGYAVWEDDLTEIIVLRVQLGRLHPEYFQVVRVGRGFYFRTLSRLTRPLIDHGELARCPLAFTEPQWMHEQYYREHAGETPGAVRLEELVARGLLLPPRPPITAESAATIPTQPDTKVPGPKMPQTTPGDY